MFTYLFIWSIGIINVHVPASQSRTGANKCRTENYACWHIPISNIGHSGKVSYHNRTKLLRYESTHCSLKANFFFFKHAFLQSCVILLLNESAGNSAKITVALIVHRKLFYIFLP